MARREQGEATGGNAGEVRTPVRRSGVSMRTSLVLGFGSVLLLTASGIVINNLYATQKVVQSLSTSILDQAASLTELKLEGFFGVVSGINSSAALRLENGLLEWQDWDSFRHFMLPMLQRVKHVSAVGAGDSEGNGYNLVRFGSNWRSQEIRPSKWGTNTLWKEWTPQGGLLREWWEGSDFDPRHRPWFTGAIEETSAAAQSERTGAFVPHWTSPYRFFTTGDYGVTVATRVPWESNLNAVVYFDVALAELDEFVIHSRPSSNGLAVVLNDDLRVLGWPGRGKYSREAVLTGAGGLEVTADQLPLLAQALQYWQELGAPDNLRERVQRDAENIWMDMRTLPLAGETIHMLTVVPEADFLGEVRREQQRMALVLGFSLLIAVALAFWLAARYTRPIAQLVSRSEAIERLDLSAQPPVPSRVREVQRLAGAQANMSTALQSFSRYVPRDVIAELLRQGEAAKIGAHPAELTVMFSDIRGFTMLSELLPPDHVAQYLSEYFDALHEIITRHQGTTDKFIGDAIMAFWGAPRPDPRHALNAVRAVLECRARLQELNAQWRTAGRPEFHTTFGLASGSVVVGNVGARDRLNYTVLGNTVNIASRCVGLGRELGCTILALESVAQMAANEIEWRRLGPVQVRGIREPMMVCEPMALSGRATPEALAFKQQYERALDAYLDRDFSAALKLLEPLADGQPRQPSVQYLIRRCHELERSDPGDLQTEMLSFN